MPRHLPRQNSRRLTPTRSGQTTKAYGRRWASSMTYKIQYLPLAVQELWKSTVCCEERGICHSIWNKFRFERYGHYKTGRVSPSGGILPFAILFPLCYTEEDHAA